MSTDSDPPVTLLLSIFILVFFSIGFCSIYFYQCFMGYVAILRGNAMQRPGSPANGLDPSIIATFPTFIYSTMKDLRQDKCSQECAVCLLEFQDDDVLRFLTICSHVFHSECIGLWFESHTTCPICRRSLDPSQKSSEKSPNIVLTASTGINQQQERELEEEEEEEVVVVERGQSHGSASAAMVERFSRSHSTGHSILQIGAEEERFSLRLPEKVKERIRRGHSWRRSCISVGDFSSNVAARNDGMTQLSRFSGGDVARV